MMEGGGSSRGGKKRKSDNPSPSKPEKSRKVPESEEMRQLKALVKQITKQMSDLNSHLLTVADIASVELLKASLDVGEILLSWKKKKPELIFPHATQKSDDCWTHALARSLAALMLQLQGPDTKELPTAKKLLDKIDRRLLTKTNLLRKTMQAAPLILEEYGYNLKVHHRPKSNQKKTNEEFEKFIERQLAIGPVGICFPVVDGYERWGNYGGDKDVFRPSKADLASIEYESLPDHCAVITGRGYVIRDGVLIEFWEIQETRGAYFKDGGFTRLERHKGLISEVFEFKRAPASKPACTPKAA